MKLIQQLRQHGILLSIAFFGLVLRLYHLDYQSFWIDELFSILQSSPEKTFGGIYTFLRENDPHQPLYYYLLHVFLSVFGDTTWVARFLSVACGIGGIFAIYAFSKEVMNKKVGLIAAFITSLSYFHVYHSQEARMYTLMFLTTTLSFLYLVKYIKKPSYKSMLWYTFFVLLMLYTHLFNLFILVAQYFILLYFVIQPYRVTTKEFFKYSFLSGVLTLLLFIPGIRIFIFSSQMNSFWVQVPAADVYTYMFKEFFGFAEMPLYIISICCIIFFVKLSQRRSLSYGKIDPIEEKQVFNFFLLFIWIFIGLLIPLVLSFVHIPVIVNRYLTNVLPAVIVLIASGFYYFKHEVVRGVLLFLFFIFSMNDLIVVKDYYNKVTKTQFRELTTALEQRSNGKETKVVVFWSWLIPYYFEDAPNMKVHPGSFDEYLNSLRAGTFPNQPFWYLDGHSRPYSVTPDNQAYLDANFTLQDKVEYHDCWANYYVPKNATEPTIVKATLSVADFKSPNINNEGVLFLFENSTIPSDFTVLEAGEYELVLECQSTPQKPINNENAHLVVSLNNQEIANFYVGANDDFSKVIPFEMAEKKKVQFQLKFDNDIALDGQDRNVAIKKFTLKKK